MNYNNIQLLRGKEHVHILETYYLHLSKFSKENAQKVHGSDHILIAQRSTPGIHGSDDWWLLRTRTVKPGFEISNLAPSDHLGGLPRSPDDPDGHVHLFVPLQLKNKKNITTNLCYM